MSNPRLNAKTRQNVKERAHFRCEYCLSPESHSPTLFSIEHVIPTALQGSDAPDNLALSCQQCNNQKFTRVEATDPQTGKMAALYNPRRHRWTEHFAWSDDKLEIVGQTPTGRATIERLQLNREGVVNLRSLLLLIGEHPSL